MDPEDAPTAEPKRRSTSILFLVVVLIIGIVGYFKGEEIMTYTMYLQEQWIQNSKVAKDKQRDKLAGPPSTRNLFPEGPHDSGDEPASVDVPSGDSGAKVSSAPEPAD